MKYFDYIFYRLYRFYDRKDDLPQLSASAIIAVLQLLNIMVVFFFVLNYTSITISKTIVVLFALMLVILNYWRYLKFRNYQQLKEKYKNETFKVQKKRKIYILVYIFLSFFLVFFLSFLKHNLKVI